MKTIAASLLFAAVYAQTACTATERLTANTGSTVCPNTNTCTNTAGVLACGASAKSCTLFSDCADETNYCAGTAGSMVCTACSANADCSAASLTQCPTTGGTAGICKADACTTPFATTTECGGTAYCRTNTCSAVCAADADCTGLVPTDVCQTLVGMCGPVCTTVADNCVTTYGSAMAAGTLCGQTSTVAAGKPVGICYTAECQVAAPTGCSSLAQECTAVTLVCNTVQCSGSAGAYVADTCPGYAANQTNMFCTTAGACTVCDNAVSTTVCGINQTCESATGNCTAIVCDPTVTDYATNLCAATKTVCVVTDVAAPTVGTCKVCDGSTTACGTGFTCNAGATASDAMTCLADACGADVSTTCAGWQVCNASNQCEGKPCDASSICAETGICDTTGGAPGVCSACVIQSPTAQQTCPTNYYCKVTDFGVCTQDCTDDSGCQAYQACTVAQGQCEGDVCTDDTGCGNLAANPTTYAKCVVESPTLSRCMACTQPGGAALTECPTGQFCSTGVAPQDGYTIGTCYNSECMAGNTDCTAVTKTCSASTGLCVDMPCTSANDATCKTAVCDMVTVPNVCTTCVVTAGVAPAVDTSNCAAGSWCTVATGECYVGLCTAGDDTTCSTITQSCNSVTLVCEQQTCATGADSECKTGLCTSSTAGADCKVCATTTECQAAGAGSQTTRYCDAATGGCFTETCTGPVSVPVAVDSCTDYTMNCINGACAAQTCVAGTASCRSGIDGTGTGGVCTSGSCAACARATSAAGVVTSDCPNASTDYCVESATAGTTNYCSPALCAATSATATTLAPVCDAWQSCDIAGTGACVQIACDATTTCATQICGSDGFCAACDATAGSGAECPATADDDTWYTCGSDGICVMTEDTGISGGGIAGIIIGSVVFLGAVVGLTLYCCKKDNKSHDAMQEALK